LEAGFPFEAGLPFIDKLLPRIFNYTGLYDCPNFTSHGVLRVLRVFVVKWFSELLSQRRHGEHGECTKTISN
jgi:hypothetical protein